MKRLCGSLLPDDVEIISESKADDNYPVVSAASIVAKVTRDNLLNQWSFMEEKASNGTLEISREMGCGYPSDPKTKVWLRDYLDDGFGFPSIVRFSWGTAKKILEDKHMLI